MDHHLERVDPDKVWVFMNQAKTQTPQNKFAYELCCPR